MSNILPRLYCYRFTLNNPTVDTVEWAGHTEIIYAVHQVEVGSSGTRHLQGFFMSNKRRLNRKWSELVFDKKADVGNCNRAHRSYCMKEDTRVSGPFEYGSWSEEHGKRSDLQEVQELIRGGATDFELHEAFPGVMSRCRKWVTEYRNVYRQSLIVPETFVPLLPWQSDLMTVLQAPPDRRKVMWWWSHAGNLGKSYFAQNYDQVRSFVVTGGKHADIIYEYNNEPIVFFDWARRQTLESFPYVVVEGLKNGYLLSTKYETVRKRFAVPHVVVFSNQAPDRSGLSEDRWSVHEIVTV